MKQCVTLFIVTALLFSCAKQDLQQEEDNLNSASAKKNNPGLQNGAYASDWEQYNNWTKKDEDGYSTYSVTKKVSELTPSIVEGGLVLTYAKVATSDAGYQQFTKPGLVPFYYLPPSERPAAGVYYFSDNTSTEQMTVSYRTQSSKAELPAMGGGVALKDFKFQYVVFTREFLDSRGLDKNTIRNYYTYEQVMNLMNR